MSEKVPEERLGVITNGFGGRHVPQRCAALAGTVCQVYAERPLACRRFECLLFGALREGEVTLPEALEVVERVDGKIDLIVSDVVMPEMDGPAMFAELRKRGVAAKVIFVSGYAEEAFAKNLPEGDFGFLAKPFSIKQLIETVKAHMP